MGAKVDRAISAVQRKGYAKGIAIAILKSRGAIHQSGRHLAAGAAKKKEAK
jgi:hypothetical protein